MTTSISTSSGAWRVERLDLDGYLERLGIPAREPSREALDEIHERHVRTFTFDNADVLLRQHPGVDLDSVSEKFVGRGRGGYCFEHSTLLSAALERLGYTVIRRLARVGDPAKGPVTSRTHLVVEVVLDGRRLLCDPGFGMSVARPIPLEDGHVDEQYGNRYRIVRAADGVVPAWRLERLRNEMWEVQHTTDELPVRPSDVELGHCYTSTSPASHFTHELIVARRFTGRHVTLTAGTVTIRHDDGATEHHDLAAGELTTWLAELNPHLSDEETARLVARLS
ncbi:arylamine N-acetyltransferase family protein [Myceligenerans crystallogenes]|uniref:Arylamine N-acetyltransferase n=1 Tax=Myceligenerans crystallogenes TaxID=316335 RepID=A0ABN2N9I7_9MICO